jgi:hypothetical protein
MAAGTCTRHHPDSPNQCGAVHAVSSCGWGSRMSTWIRREHTPRGYGESIRPARTHATDGGAPEKAKGTCSRPPR